MSVIILEDNHKDHNFSPVLSLYYFDDIDSSDYESSFESPFSMKVYSRKVLKDHLGDKITHARPIIQSQRTIFSLVPGDTFVFIYTVDRKNSDKTRIIKDMIVTFKNDYEIDFILKKVGDNGEYSEYKMQRLAFEFTLDVEH